MTKAAIAIATAVMVVAALAVSIGVSRNLDQQLREQDRRLDALTGNVEVFAALESLDLRLANLKAETIQQTRTTSYAQLGHHRRIRDLEARLAAMGIPEATPAAVERMPVDGEPGPARSPGPSGIPGARPGSIEPLTAECEATLIGVNPRILLDSLQDPLRTAYDSANSAGCRFSQPIARVTLSLWAGNSRRYVETFLLEPPSPVVQFPLVGFESDRVGGPLQPGDYTRRLVAFTEYGTSWDLTAGTSGFSPTVTVAPTPAR